MKTIVVMLELLILILAGCSGKVAEHVEEPRQIIAETTRDYLVYFCPQDNCTERFLALAENASKIDCALYDLDIPAIIEVLEKKNARIVIDRDNLKGLQNSTLDYMTNDGSQLSHNKFCVFDRRVVWTGSFNPTMSENRENNNNVVVLFSRYIAENYEQEFLELWQGGFGSGQRVNYPVVFVNGHEIENYFCPEDCVGNGALALIVELIGKANSSIYFMTFSFTVDSIGSLLIEKQREDVVVKGIFEKSQNSRYSEYSKLGAAGLDVRFDGNRFQMHHKVFIIDGKVVITGSWNPTKSGTERNDENILIMHDEAVAKKYLEEFESLWSRAQKQQ
jgi:phosphatidylserine/phosphatidylglycerophosphate/cardiolipin synthase-like enzyme